WGAFASLLGSRDARLRNRFESGIFEGKKRQKVGLGRAFTRLMLRTDLACSRLFISRQKSLRHNPVQFVHVHNYGCRLGYSFSSSFTDSDFQASIVEPAHSLLVDRADLVQSLHGFVEV